jgi:hypothetical protein
LLLVALIVYYCPFPFIVLLLLLASQSLWLRGLGWSAAGLCAPASTWRTVAGAVFAAAAILSAVRFAILPFAVWITGESIDLSALGVAGDPRALWTWLAYAWTLAAFGEEMVFRGYLIPRLTGLLGDTTFGRAIAVVTSSALFGIAHRYQGWTGVIETATVGALLGLLYLYARQNLWMVIICHAIVDTAALTAIYFDRSSLLFP